MVALSFGFKVPPFVDLSILPYRLFYCSVNLRPTYLLEKFLFYLLQLCPFNVLVGWQQYYFTIVLLHLKLFLQQSKWFSLFFTAVGWFPSWKVLFGRVWFSLMLRQRFSLTPPPQMSTAATVWRCRSAVAAGASATSPRASTSPGSSNMSTRDVETRGSSPDKSVYQVQWIERPWLLLPLLPLHLPFSLPPGVDETQVVDRKRCF